MTPTPTFAIGAVAIDDVGVEGEPGHPCPLSGVSVIAHAVSVRLTAARTLEHFTDPVAFLKFVTQLFNDRGEEQPWKIGEDIVDTVAELIANGGPHLKSAHRPSCCGHSAKKNSTPGTRPGPSTLPAMPIRLPSCAVRSKQSHHRSTLPTQLQELAFGAYVGLVREQGGAANKQERAGLVVRVRQTALSRILALATADPHYARPPNRCSCSPRRPQSTRAFQAFEQLQQLHMDGATLGAEALETGHTDLGIKGLELLGASAKGGQGDKVIEQVMLTRGDNLGLEAAKLLVARGGQTPVAIRALEATNDEVRKQAVQWLAADYEKNPKAQEGLRKALDSRYGPVRNRVALELAGKKDPAAFSALVNLLNTAPDAENQNRAAWTLVTLGDPPRRTPLSTAWRTTPPAPRRPMSYSSRSANSGGPRMRRGCSPCSRSSRSGAIRRSMRW